MAFSPDPFFIGWAKKPPKALHTFLLVVSITLGVGLAAAGTLIGSNQTDPQGGKFRFDLREQEVIGTLIAKPYPMIWLGDGQSPHIHTRMIMLNGNGKTGVGERAAQFDGSQVLAKGIILERGDLQMLQLNRKFESLNDQDAEQPEREDLGRWRLSGEICDGRCYVGAMRPGDGIAHKACANLCIDGGQPPVFVATSPVEGTSFMLLGSADYGPLPTSMLNYSGVLIEIEGRLERIGDLTLLLVDPASVEVL